MADRYWNPVGAANWADANVWALTDGGDPTGIAAPTSSDNVYFTSTNINNCTVAATANCLNLDFTGGTGYTGTLAGASALNIYGSSTLNAGMVRTYTGTITFKATATGKTIRCNGVTLNSNVDFSGVGGEWTLQDALNVGTKWITLANGSFSTNGMAVTAASVDSANSNVRTLTLGASTLTLSGTNPWSFGIITNLTFNANTSTINCTSTAAAASGGGLTYNNFTLVRATLYGANTFANLTVNGDAAITAQILFVADQTITGTLTITGNSLINRILVCSDVVGTARILTAATVSLANCDFRDITGAGAAAPFTGTSLGNALGNTNITTTTPVTRYWVGGTGSYSSTGEWSATSGGASGASAPLCHDTVVFDANSFSAGGQTCTINVARIPSIDFTNSADNPNVTFSFSCEIYGSLNLIGVNTFSTGTTTVTFSGRSGHTITSNSKLFNSGVTFNGIGGVYTLQDNFAADGAAVTDTLILYAGTLDANDFDVDYPKFDLDGGADTLTRVFSMGNGVITCSGTGLAWDVSPSTGLTLNAEGSTLVISNVSATLKTITGGDFTYNNVTFSGDNITLTGNNTFNSFNVNTAGLTTGLKLTAGTTQVISAFTTNGSAENLAKLVSTSAGSAATLSMAAGQVSVDYMSIKDSTATGGAAWYAGANSTNVSGNTGWIFSAPASGATPTMTANNNYYYNS